MSKRYNPRPYRPTGGNDFVYTGSVRECPECFSVGGHQSYCDKVK